MKQQIDKSFYSYLWAYILVALSACMGNVVDGIIVGNLISGDAVSAINLSKPINQFIFTIHLLINAGAGMLVAYALGKNDSTEARRLFSRALTLSVGLGFTLAIVGGLLLPGATARWLCNNEQLLPLASDYMRILLLGNPAFILMWGLSTMVGVDGSPKLVSMAVIIDNVANLLLDIVFIQWLGWGIAGSSAATVVGHLIGIGILLTHWLTPRAGQAPSPLRLDLATDGLLISWRRIVSQGAPLAIASICLTLLLFSANSIVLDNFGRAGIFAFSVCMNLLQIYNLFVSGTCQTLQSLGAIHVGQGDNDGVRIIVRKAFRFISIAMATTCLVVWIFPTDIVQLFGGREESFVSEGVRALRIFALSFIPFCYIYVLMIVYKLYHHHSMALFISLALSLTVIPVLWAMARWLPDYFWYSYLIAYMIEAVAIFLIHKGRHLRFELSGQ
ncbi:MAG: hypothetical protein IJ620_00575 [Bacteroidales bacterium]|nr:hypothetical protein [Bacteroidales bacterium]